MALVELPVQGADDGALLEAMEAAAWTGVDAPFGWPEPFVRAVAGYGHVGEWPVDVASDELRLRATDRFVRHTIKESRAIGLTPLSVSSDRIAVCAWRCAGLLRDHRARTGLVLDRVGVPLTTGADGPPNEHRPVGIVAPRGVVETYPAAALAMWGLPWRGYKASRRAGIEAARAQRAAILSALDAQAAGWLVISEDAHAACVASDHCLDALLSALVAIAAATDVTIRPTLAQRGLARAEGWIHLPEPDCLAGLAPAGM
jgi:predicted nuclease with RNAse H fold